MSDFPTDSSTDPAVTSRRRRLPRPSTGIQSKLLVMLLLSSILSAVVVGFFGYRSGTDALKDAAYSRLTEVRDERSNALEDFATSMRAGVVLDSQGVGVEASKAFNSAFAELEDAEVSSADRDSIRSYYEKTFIPNLERNVGGDLDVDAFLPSKPQRSYLQANYTSRFKSFDEAVTVDDAGDGSDWTAANKKFNPYFRAAIESLSLDDVMLLNPEGQVVYTAYKGVDLGSNVKTGEYRGGGLEKVFDEAVRSNSRDSVSVADFEQYQPSYGDPTMFIASPVGTARNLTGVLVYQVSAEKINSVMSGNDDIDKFTGLGETGETFLVGPDGTLRSNERILVEDPKRFKKLTIERGTDPSVADRMVRTGNAMLLQSVSESRAVQRASRGESGVLRTTGFLGADVLDSYAPVDFFDTDWSIVAKINTDEALAPTQDFARNIAIATAVIVLLVSAASVLMARVFTAPLDRLVTGVRAVAGGQLGVQVDAGTRDEFGDLGAAFNDMSSNLAAKDEMLTAQRLENERLLGGMMPPTVAQRYRGGETSIFDEHDNVTIGFADIDGFAAATASKPAAEAHEMLMTLSRGFDDAAKAAGIERVRSSGTSYVAACGLAVQRVDHARRVVDFALAVEAMTDRFNSQFGTDVAVRAGVDSGAVRSGLVGQTDVVYNLWGDAVNLAYRLRQAPGEPGIFVTDEVKDRLANAYAFESGGTVADGASERIVWRVLARGGN